MACMLHDDENVMTMFSMFADISKLTCLDLYITIVDPPTQTCEHPPPISDNSFNFEGFNEYLAKSMNLELSFDEPPPPPNLFVCYFII